MNKLIIIGVALFGLGAASAITGSVISGERLLPIATRADYELADPYVKDVDNVTSLVMMLKNRQINIYPTDGNNIELSYYESEYDRFDISFASGTVTINNEVDPYLFFGGLNFFWGYQTVFTVELGIPESSTFEIEAYTSNGAIESGIFEEMGALKFETSNGAITMETIDTLPSIDLKTSNGQIELSQMNITDSLRVITSNGRINITDVTCPDIEGTTSNGNVLATSITTQSLDLHTSNGEVHAEVIGDMANYRVKMQTSNGHYYLEGERVTTNAYNTHLGAIIDLSTSNGDIKLWCS
jgi:hypothetical protein